MKLWQSNYEKAQAPQTRPSSLVHMPRKNEWLWQRQPQVQGALLGSCLAFIGLCVTCSFFVADETHFPMPLLCTINDDSGHQSLGCAAYQTPHKSLTMHSVEEGINCVQ